MPEVFLSYSRADAAHAAALNAWLAGQGVRSFFDQRDLGGGQLWLPDLERAIETEAAAVLVGPQGLGNTQQYEAQLALTRQAREPGFPVIPVILPGTPAWRWPRGFLTLPPSGVASRSASSTSCHAAPAASRNNRDAQGPYDTVRLCGDRPPGCPTTRGGPRR